MKVLDFIFCEDINTTVIENGKQSNIILNPLGAFYLEFIPSQYTFAFVLMVNNVEKNEKYTIKMTHPELEKPIFEGKGIIDISNLPADRDKEGFVINITGKLQNAVFLKSGYYTLRIDFDDDNNENYEKKIYVYTKQQIQ